MPNLQNGTIVLVGNSAADDTGNDGKGKILPGTELIMFCDNGFLPINSDVVIFLCQDDGILTDVDLMKCNVYFASQSLN